MHFTEYLGKTSILSRLCNSNDSQTWCAEILLHIHPFFLYLPIILTELGLQVVAVTSPCLLTNTSPCQPVMQVPPHVSCTLCQTHTLSLFLALALFPHLEHGCDGCVPADTVKHGRACLPVNQKLVLLLAVTNILW